jgi:hypothetical protein
MIGQACDRGQQMRHDAKRASQRRPERCPAALQDAGGHGEHRTRARNEHDDEGSDEEIKRNHEAILLLLITAFADVTSARADRQTSA